MSILLVCQMIQQLRMKIRTIELTWQLNIVLIHKNWY